MDNYGLICKFTDASDSFCHGFEAGIIWHRMEGESQPFEITLHSANRQQCILMAQALGWSVTFEPLESIKDEGGGSISFHEWLQATFSKSKVLPFKVIQGGHHG